MLAIITNQKERISNLMISKECIDTFRISFDELQKNISIYYIVGLNKNMYNINQKEIPTDKINKLILEFHKLNINKSITFTNNEILIDGEEFK